MAKERVIIIGAGILGCSLAYHLARRGYRCTVLEKEAHPAKHASGRSSGMLRALYRHPQLTDWAVRSLELLPEEIRSREILRTGSIIVGRTVPDHHPGLFEQIEFPDRLRNGQKETAVYCGADGLISSESFTRSIWGLAKAAGAVIQTETRVNSAGKNAGNWEILSSSGNAEHIHTAEVVVNAAGAWLNALRPSGSVDKVARAFARHLFTIQAPSSDAGLLPDTGFLWDERDYFYIRKLSGGRALFSLCDESEIDPDAEPSGESLHKLLGEKLELYAAKFGAVWSGAPEIFAQRWCLRTYHPDQLPILCKDPQHAGYFWIGAFGGFGMSTGFAAAEDLARIISGEAEQNPEFALRPAP